MPLFVALSVYRLGVSVRVVIGSAVGIIVAADWAGY